MKIEGYTDADWAGSADNRRSTSGYFTFVGGNLVTWRSKKQPVVARSSAEAEYRGMAFGVCELLWLRNLLRDLGVNSKDTMNLYCDNTSAIEIAHNPVQHDRTKHVEVDRHFIKEKLEAGIIIFPFVKSENQLADILTKAVASQTMPIDNHNQIAPKLDLNLTLDLLQIHTLARRPYRRWRKAEYRWPEMKKSRTIATSGVSSKAPSLSKSKRIALKSPIIIQLPVTKDTRTPPKISTSLSIEREQKYWILFFLTKQTLLLFKKKSVQPGSYREEEITTENEKEKKKG
ncbi:hypothetical protein UlMin_003255 [Ulmus minor]